MENLNSVPKAVQFVTKKPVGSFLVLGKETKTCVNKSRWLFKKKSFTIINLSVKNNLQLFININPLNASYTNEPVELKKNAKLPFNKTYGTITYKKEGALIFVGDKITPFIANLKKLIAKNEICYSNLIFANKSKADINFEKEFEAKLGETFINILPPQQCNSCSFGIINEKFIKEKTPNFNHQFYNRGGLLQRLLILKIFSSTHW